MKASFRSRQVDTVAEVVFGATGHVERLAHASPLVQTGATATP